MKILVTGAAGYIGNGVVKQLLRDGMNVIATDRVCTSGNRNVEYICTDLFSIENPYDFFGFPDAVLHLAWRDGFEHSSDSHVDDFAAHYHFIKKMIDGGIKQVCIMGSVHEIGFFEGAVSESTPTNPRSLYGISKNALRTAIEVYTKNKQVVFQWIRGFYIVGNTSMGSSVFSKITIAEKKGQVYFPFTNGNNQFDFLDYDDFCFQVASVIEQTKVTGIINCASGFPQKIGERVEKFIKDNNYNIKLQYGMFPERPYDSKAIWGNTDKINRIISIRQNVIEE